MATPARKPRSADSPFVGRPLKRKEDSRLLKGKGRFVDDFNLGAQAYAVMVRSAYPHARINGIDASAALALEGVLAVYTGEDCARAGLKPIPHNPVPSPKSNLPLTAPGGGEIFIGPHLPLPIDKVRHVGEAVAMVVAETRALAEEAADLVMVDYEPLEFVTDSRAALAPGAPSLWDELPGNLAVDATFGDTEATERAFKKAAHVVSRTFHVGRVTGVPLEPRAAIGEYDADTGRYTLYEASNGAVRHRREIAEVLGIAPENLRVLCYDVGGNFGTKNRVYVEQPLVLFAARALGRPVKFTATRSESFLSDYQGRDLVSEVSLALDADGRFLGLKASNLSNLGARAVSLSPLGKGVALVTGSYAIPTATARARAVYTNTVPTQAYRSSGRPEVCHALERLIDIAAAEFGFDRIELRRKNLVPAEAMPYRNALGIQYDSGEYAENMRRAMALANWEGFPARAEAARRRGLRLGRGLANYVESSVGAPDERADLIVTADGRVTLVIGTQPTGQGHETSFAQVLADLIGVEFAAIETIVSDTDIVKAGGGSHSGRSMRHAATVLCRAAAQLIERGKSLAAQLWQTEPGNVDFAAGVFGARSGPALDWFGLVHEAQARGLLGFEGLKIECTNTMHTPVFPNGCAVCEVEVDPATGSVKIVRYVSVDDVGRAINPLIVDGQTHGSIATGVGQALGERVVLDADSGQVLTGSLMDYALPRADELPLFRTELNEVLSPTNPLGIKSAGEGPTTAALPVVINAIVDALSEYGIEDIEMPATPFRVWSAIQEARKVQPASEPAIALTQTASVE